MIARRLKLTKANITAIDVNNKTEEVKRVVMLEKWKERFASKGNGETLIEALLAARKTTQAIEVAKIIGTGNIVCTTRV